MPNWTDHDRLCRLLIAALAITGTAGSALAQTQPSDSTAVSEKPATAAVLPEDATTTPSTDPSARFDALAPKGWATPFPGASDTVVRDTGGIRTTLADQGIAVTVIAASSFQYDLLQNDRGYRGPPLYNGHQKVTRNASFVSVYASSDLGRFGLSGGQLNFVASLTSNSLPSINGPRTARVEILPFTGRDRVPGVTAQASCGSPGASAVRAARSARLGPEGFEHERVRRHVRQENGPHAAPADR